MYEKPSRVEIETTNPSFDVVERIEGQWMFLVGHPFPIYAAPSVETVERVNVVKKILSLQPLKAAEEALDGITLKEEYMHPCARELRKQFTGRLGQIVAQVINYDSAYRLRLQDLLSESNKETLSRKPIREIIRLVGINKRRDHADAHKKVKKAALLLCLGLLWPAAHYRFRKSVSASDYTNFTLSDADRYWLKYRTDYTYNA